MPLKLTGTEKARQARCDTNIQDWVRDELLPWFASRPRNNWTNPRVVTS
jgi:hypothetical protein